MPNELILMLRFSCKLILCEAGSIFFFQMLLFKAVNSEKNLLKFKVLCISSNRKKTKQPSRHSVKSASFEDVGLEKLLD